MERNIVGTIPKDVDTALKLGQFYPKTKDGYPVKTENEDSKKKETTMNKN